jgi:hypothetical protein
LRDYESRLRALQAEIEAGRAAAQHAPAYAPAYRGSASPMFQRPSSRAPFTDDPVLASAWDKLHRAREILEAEQRNLCDDRLALRDFESQLRAREESLNAREQLVAQREAQAVVVVAPEVTPTPDESVSAVAKLTRAPFNMALSVLGKMK